MKFKQITTKIPDKDAQIVERISEHRGENISDFVRRAIKLELARLNYLDEESRRALGVEINA